MALERGFVLGYQILIISIGSISHQKGDDGSVEPPQRKDSDVGGVLTISRQRSCTVIRRVHFH